ncbi:MAG: hypothetical protein IJ689_05910 [Alphaproteobacteria bacterium]|nr:hypothetical protein [Alphaproteobacteria bacterium]
MVWFYVLMLIMLPGIGLFNLSICKYFDAAKKVNFTARLWGVLPIAFFLLLWAYLQDIWFICFAFSLLFFIGIISWYDYQKGNPFWWKLSWFDCSVIAYIALSNVLMCSYEGCSWRGFLFSINFDVMVFYVFFLKQIRKQKKFIRLFSNRYIRFAETVWANVFYYAEVFLLWIYIVITTVNVIKMLGDPMDIDGCLDNGVCKEGYVFDVCDDGKSCVITKDWCLKNGNVWYEETRRCDTRTRQTLEN